MHVTTAVILLLLVSIPARSQLFEQNVGQFNRADVQYLCRIDGMTVLFTSQGLTYVRPHETGVDTMFVDFQSTAPLQLVPSQPASHTLRYYTAAYSIDNVPQYQQLLYREVASGVDVLFYIHRGILKYDVLAKSGALAEELRFVYNDASLQVLPSGDVSVRFGEMSSITEDAPVSWVYGDRGVPVDVNYVVEQNTLGWNVSEEFLESSIVIDPGVRWSLLHGGGREEFRVAVANDASNNVFVAGATESIQWGSSGFSGVVDGYVSRYSSSGDLQWTILYGGSEAETITDVCVSPNGSKVYAAGYSESSDLPTNRLATSPEPSAGLFGFIAEFSTTDGKHVASTRWGGGGECEVLALTCASNGDLVIGGKALSGWYHVSPSAIQTTFKGIADGFVARVDADLQGYSWSTLLGSDAANDREVVTGVTMTPSGDVGFTGYVSGGDIPLTHNAFQVSNAGQSDAIVGLLKGADGDTIFCSYMGGSSSDYAYGIASDNDGKLVVVGETVSSMFPTTSGAFKTQNTFNADAFVFKVNPQSGALEWSTLYGADDKEDLFRSVVVNSSNDIVAVGNTGADEFPIITPTFQNEYSGGREDAVVVAFNSAGTPQWNSFLGGSVWDEAYDVSAFNSVSLGDVVVVGRTSSDNFPVTALPLNSQKTRAGNFDSFVTVFNTCEAPQPLLEDKEICAGETVELHPINGTYSYYLWRESGNNTLVNNTSSLEVSSAGKYSVVVTDASGCSGVSNIASVDVLPMPEFEINLSNPNGDTTFCEGDQLTMQVQGPSIRKVTWSNGVEANSYTFTEPGFFSVEIEGTNGCSTTASFEVREIVVPTPVATPDTVVCRGEPVELYVESAGTNFLWFGENLTDEGKRRTLAYPTQSTDYTVRIEFRGCIETTTISVSVVDPPEQPASREILACVDQPLDLDLPDAHSVDVYDEFGGIVCLNCPEDATYVTSASTQLRVAVANEANCAVETTLNIVVRDTSALNIFAFDGDVVDFGVLQGCDTEILDSVIIQNGQAGAVEISHVFVDSPAFGVKPFNPVLAATDTSVLIVSFAAAQTGQFNGILNVVLQPCGDTLKMPLKGARTSSNVQLSLNGSDIIGTRAACDLALTTTITVRNTGEEVVTLTGPITSPAFTFTNDPSGTVLFIGEEVDLEIQFVASEPGSYAANVGVTWESSSCTSESVVNLKGTSTTPEVVISALSVDFGKLSPCTTLSVTTLSVTNAGNEPMTLTDVIGNPAFTVEATTAIAPGATEILSVRFNPQGAGPVNGDVDLVFEPCSISTTLSISGSWWGSEFSVQQSIDVTVSECTRSTGYTITISNDSDIVPGTIVSVQVPDGFAYELPLDTELLPRSQRDITFVVDGQTPAGISTAIVSLVVDGCERTVFVNTLVRYAETTIASTSVDIGVVPYNYSGLTTVTVTNTGETTLTLVDTSIAGGGFRIVSVSQNELQPGESAEVVVEFTAQTEGITSATVSYHLSGLCELVTTSSIVVEVAPEPTDVPTIQLNTNFHYVKLNESGQTESFDLPFSGVLQGSVASGLTMDVEYNASVLHIENIMVPGQLIANNIIAGTGVVRLFIPQEFVGTNWSGLVVRPLLGNATTSSLTVLQATAGNARVTSATGTVFVTGFCQEGGTRLVRNSPQPLIDIHDNGGSDASVVVSHAIPNSTLRISDASGRIVFERKFSNRLTLTPSIDLPWLSSGMYVVSVASNYRMKTKLLQYNR